MIDAGTLAPLVITARTLLGLVLLTAAASKLRDPAAFHGAVHGYRLLPDGLVGPVAAVLPWMEVAIGLLVPSGLLPVAAAIVAVMMFVVFAGAMTVNLLRGRRHIDCGCFRGRPSQTLTWGTVLRTLAFAAAAVVSGLPAMSSLAAAAQGLTAGAILFLLFVAGTALPTFGRKRPRISL